MSAVVMAGLAVTVLAAMGGGALAIVGLALGRCAPKVDPVGEPCLTCDGPRRVRWDVVPFVAPARCPECHRSVAAPTVVIVIAVALVLGALSAGGDRGWLLVANGLLGCALAALVWTDARYRLLPAGLVWAAMALSLLAFAGADAVGDETDGRLLQAVLVAGATGLVFLVLHLINPSGMAFGDIRLAILLGLHLGWRSPEVAYWGVLLALLLAYIFGQLRKRTGAGNTLPFGPFLAIGAAVALLASAGGQ